MFPLRDENPSGAVPWITYLLMAANVAVFALCARVFLEAGPAAYERVLVTWGFVPARFFASPLSPRELITPFSSMFLHAGVLHLAGNMLYLWIFGDNVEHRLGSLRFLGFYLAGGLVAVAAQTLPAAGSTAPLVGASGAISAVLGAYLLLFPRSRILTAVFLFIYFELTTLPAALVIGMWFVLQVAAGVTGQASTAGGGVAYWAHVGGFLAGMVMCLPLWWADRRATRWDG